MSALLDPWRDARILAERLKKSGTRLVIALGAEAWCEKCRLFRPHFNARAAEARGNEVWLWLDLEDHAEFVGDYLPEDLPQLIVYENAALVACRVVQPTAESLETALTEAHCFRTDTVDPGMRARLLQEDWVV